MEIQKMEKNYKFISYFCMAFIYFILKFKNKLNNVLQFYKLTH